MPPSIRQEQNLIDLIGSVKRHFYLILFFCLMGLVIGVLAVTLLPRKFEAQAMLTLDTSEQNFGSAGPANPATLSPPVESIVLSQAEVLRSRDIAELVVNDLKLDEDKIFWSGYHRPSDKNGQKQMAIQHLVNDLTIKPVGRSLVIDVRFRHIDAVMAAKITNRLVDLYQEQQVKEKILYSKQTASWLENRLDILGKKLRESAKAVEEYSAREDLIDGEKAQLTSQQISEISSQLIRAQAELAASEAKKSQIDALLKKGLPLDQLDEIEQARIVGVLKENEIALQSELAQLQTKYGKNHPRILALQAELGQALQKQKTEINAITKKIDNRIGQITAKIDILQKNMTALEDKKRRENHAAIGLRELQREADANRSLYKNFLHRYKESKMLGDIQQPDTKIISMARVPLFRAGPHPLLIIMALTFAGFVLGLMVTLLVEHLETYIRTPVQIRELTGLQCLASLPEIPQAAPDHILDRPYGAIAESLRGMGMRLISRGLESPHVISVTSCFEREGKTNLAIWTARLLAQAGIKVLLIDGNLRAPSIGNKMNLNSHYPLTDLIFQKRTQTDLITTDTKIPSLSILHAVASPQHDITRLNLGAVKTLSIQQK